MDELAGSSARPNAKALISRSPVTNSGSPTKAIDRPEISWSAPLSFLSAATTPRRIPTGT